MRLQTWEKCEGCCWGPILIVFVFSVRQQDCVTIDPPDTVLLRPPSLSLLPRLSVDKSLPQVGQHFQFSKVGVFAGKKVSLDTCWWKHLFVVLIVFSDSFLRGSTVLEKSWNLQIPFSRGGICLLSYTNVGYVPPSPRVSSDAPFFSQTKDQHKYCVGIFKVLSNCCIRLDKVHFSIKKSM